MDRHPAKTTRHTIEDIRTPAIWNGEEEEEIRSNGRVDVEERK